MTNVPERWGRAAMPILALESGFPAVEQSKRPLVMLQAYVDDSGKGEEPFFVLAGFVSPTEKWLAFTDQWAAKLQEHPSINYFKMRDAAALRGEFSRFTESQRDKRVNDLIEIINSNADFFTFCEIEKETWGDVFPNQFAKTMDTPFYHAYCIVMNVVFTHMYRGTPRDTAEFIFDKENETLFREVLDWWLLVRSQAPRWMRSRMGNMPVMRDDKDILPLQAADLLAWLVAKRHVPPPQKEFAQRFVSNLTVGGSYDTWEGAKIEEMARQMMTARGTQFTYESGAARSARLNQLLSSRK